MTTGRFLSGLQSSTDCARRVARALCDHRGTYPAVMRISDDYLKASLFHLRCSLTHYKETRTPNLLKHTLDGILRYAKVILHFTKVKDGLVLANSENGKSMTTVSGIATFSECSIDLGDVNGG